MEKLFRSRKNHMKKYIGESLRDRKQEVKELRKERKGKKEREELTERERHV